MAPSEVKRFASYLNDLRPRTRTKPSHTQESLTALGTDFEVTIELLDQFGDDERVRNVLMDTTEGALDRAIEDVRQELRSVEIKSIGAYIEQSKPLDDLHHQVSLDFSLKHICMHAVQTSKCFHRLVLALWVQQCTKKRAGSHVV
jgi:hypothetical protein